MSISTGLPPAGETISLNQSNSNAVLSHKDGMPNCATERLPQAIALANIPASHSENVHHLYAQMHSLVDQSVNCTPPALDS
ncbi:MAG TPA: hypothetical protein V6D48_14490 [Oculatellaceae cyanobacterium]